MEKMGFFIAFSKRIYFAWFLAFINVSIPVFGQSDKETTSISGIALYEGSDRQQRLLEGAKKEGQLTVYTSMPVEDITVLTQAFEKKYGVKIKLWRASSQSVVQKIITETRGGKFDFDVVEANGPKLESLYREKLLQKVKSPYQDDLIPRAIPPHREWIGTRLNIFVFGYNTKLVNKESLPKTYQDLLDPIWKGRLGVEAQEFDWLATVAKELGEEKGLKLFRDIVATNGVSVRKGQTLLTNLVASGEVPLALTVYNYKVEQLKQKGAPIDWFVIPPAIARANGVAVSKKAPHLHAAILFYDFMINDAQHLLLKTGTVPASKKINTPLNKLPIKFIDPAIVLDESDKWNKLYAEIITRQK